MWSMTVKTALELSPLTLLQNCSQFSGRENGCLGFGLTCTIPTSYATLSTMPCVCVHGRVVLYVCEVHVDVHRNQFNLELDMCVMFDCIIVSFVRSYTTPL